MIIESKEGFELYCLYFSKGLQNTNPLDDIEKAELFPQKFIN